MTLQINCFHPCVHECTCCRTDLILTRCFPVSPRGLHMLSATTRLRAFDSPQALLFAPAPTKLTPCTLGGGAGAHVSDYQSRPRFFFFFLPSRRLTETRCELHACLRLKQRHRRACLNASRFCHNGRAFGGFAHLLQRINLSILHNAALLPNPSINISPL